MDTLVVPYSTIKELYEFMYSFPGSSIELRCVGFWGSATRTQQGRLIAVTVVIEPPKQAIQRYLDKNFPNSTNQSTKRSHG